MTPANWNDPQLAQQGPRLCAYTDLPPDRVDELRDLMIFG